MAAFEEQSFVALLRHFAGRVAHALEGPSFERERHGIPGADNREYERAAAWRDFDDFDIEFNGWFKTLAGGCEIVKCLLADLLANKFAVRLRADDHPAPFAIRERAQSLQSLPKFTRCALQLKRGGFAFGNESAEGGGHGQLSVPSGARYPLRRGLRLGVGGFKLGESRAPGLWSNMERH